MYTKFQPGLDLTVVGGAADVTWVWPDARNPGAGNTVRNIANHRRLPNGTRGEAANKYVAATPSQQVAAPVC